jgi:transposase
MSSITVLTSRERRRRWSASEKARIVEESFAAGAIVAEVARRHDVNTNLLHLWRRQVRGAPIGRARFLPVSIASAAGVGAGVIEIEFGSGVRVRVDGAVDEAALGRVLRALGR